MTDAEKVKLLREALQALTPNAQFWWDTFTSQVDASHAVLEVARAALAATAGPATYELRDGERRAVGAPEWSDPFKKPECAGPHVSAFDCPLHDPRQYVPSPAPRDAEREALLAFGEKVRAADDQWRCDAFLDGGIERARPDLAALLPVKP